MAPRDHHLVGKKNISLEEIAAEPNIVREPGSGVRDTTFRTFEAKGLRPKVRMELGSNEAIKHAVMSGLGISILSEHTLTYGGAEGLVKLRVKELPIESTWYLVRLRSRRLSLIAEAFLDYLQVDGLARLSSG